MSRIVASALALAIALLFGFAAAAPRPLAQSLEGEAKKAYEDARIAFDAGDFAAALLKFDKAHELSHDARLLWNMAGCQTRLRRYARALALLDRYVSEGGDALTEADRREAADKRGTIAAFVGTLTLRVAQDGADVYVDDEHAGKTPLSPLSLDQGKHRLRVTKRGYRERAREVELEGGGSALVELELAHATGRLAVRAGAEDQIHVDGRRRAAGSWSGKLAVGAHDIEAKSPDGTIRRRRVVLEDGESERVRFAEPDEPVIWPWIAAGVAVTVAAIVVTSYFVLKPDDQATGPTPGTLGVFELP